MNVASLVVCQPVRLGGRTEEWQVRVDPQSIVLGIQKPIQCGHKRALES